MQVQVLFPAPESKRFFRLLFIVRLIPNNSRFLKEIAKDLDKASSAGLRVLLAARKTMKKQGKMIIHHVNETMMDVFEVTGFIDILTIA